MARKRDTKAADKGKTADQPTSRRRSTGVRVSAGAASSDGTAAEKPEKASNTKKMSANGVRKGAAKRGRSKKNWSEDFVTTNAKSPLVNVDLVKLFANPNSWTCLDEDEKQEILDLLPDHVRPVADPEAENPVIPPLSQEFLRYSNNWRDGVRQYQSDLEQGKYEPEWLRQAAQAMEERAAGKFDKWKEQEFEQFWGQKQKLSHGVIAGTTTRVKLMTLVEHKVVQVGDVWKFTRVFRMKTGGTLHIEKEIKIIDKDEKSLTFAIPPGSRIFLSRNYDYGNDEVPSKSTPRSTRAHPKASPFAEVTGTIKQAASKDAEMDEAEPPTADDQNGAQIPPVKSERQDHITPEIQELLSDEDSELSTVPPSSPEMPGSPGGASIKSESEVSKKRRRDTAGTESIKPKVSADEDEHTMDIENDLPNATADACDGKGAGNDDASRTAHPIRAAISSRPSKNSSSSNADDIPKDIILKNVSSLQTLVYKILAIDGRITDPPNGNAWKEFRCYRNNQDIGSPWEIRQEWWVRHPELHHLYERSR